MATARLLWAACRPAPDPEAIADAIGAGADVEHAGQVAVAQGTGPLLWRALEGTESLDLLGESRDLLWTEVDLLRAQAHLVLPVAVAVAIDPLVRAGLEPVLFKGPALAERYPAPGLRPMVDIDVVLPPEQHERALRALTAASWRIVGRSGQHHDTYLHHPKVPDLALELHWDLYVWHDRATRMSGSNLWEQRVPMECLGVKTFGLPPEVELVALAAHAGKPHHHFHRLVWSVDFTVVIDTTVAGIDWDEVDRLARAAGCRTAVSVALCHAARLGAGAPADLQEPHVGRIRRNALLPLFDETWPLVECDDGLHRRLRYALWDSPARRLALFVGEITEAGVRYAPRRAAMLVRFALRRAWRSLRAPGAGA